MFHYRFRRPGSRFSYVLSQDRDSHWLVSEHDARTGGERRFRTTGGAVQTVLNLPEVEQYAGAASLYHRQRIAERNRKSFRRTGGDNGERVAQ